MSGVSDEFSVTAADGAQFDPRILGRRSCTPCGPFGPGAELYRMPESGAAGSYRDPGIYRPRFVEVRLRPDWMDAG